MVVKGKNFAGQVTPKIIAEEYYNCNFSHKMLDEKDGKKVGWRIFPDDDTPRKFVECNLTNCIPPPGSELINCNRTIAEVGIKTPTEEKIRVHGYFDAKTEKAVYFTKVKEYITSVEIEAIK